MYEKPEIVYSVTKEELLNNIEKNNLTVEMYGCPSGSNYSSCMNS